MGSLGCLPWRIVESQVFRMLNTTIARNVHRVSFLFNPWSFSVVLLLSVVDFVVVAPFSRQTTDREVVDC